MLSRAPHTLVAGILLLAAGACATSPAESTASPKQWRVLELTTDEGRFGTAEPRAIEDDGWTDYVRNQLDEVLDTHDSLGVLVRTTRRVRHRTLMTTLRTLDRAGTDTIHVQIEANRPFLVARPEPRRDEDSSDAHESTAEQRSTDEKHRQKRGPDGMAVMVYPSRLHLLSDGRAHPDSPVCAADDCDRSRYHDTVKERFRRMTEQPAEGRFQTIESPGHGSEATRELMATLDRRTSGASLDDLDDIVTEMTMSYRWRWLHRTLGHRRQLQERGYLAPPSTVAVAVEGALPVALLERVRRAFCPVDTSTDDPTAPSHELALREGRSCRHSPDGFVLHELAVREEER